MEVRTEEERTPNHDGGKHTEPNETTPLTEPEYVGGRGRHVLAEPHPHRITPPTPPCSHPKLSAQHRRPEFRSPEPGMPDPTLPREEAFLVLCGWP